MRVLCIIDMNFVPTHICIVYMCALRHSSSIIIYYFLKSNQVRSIQMKFHLFFESYDIALRISQRVVQDVDVRTLFLQSGSLSGQLDLLPLLRSGQFFI